MEDEAGRTYPKTKTPQGGQTLAEESGQTTDGQTAQDGTAGQKTDGQTAQDGTAGQTAQDGTAGQKTDGQTAQDGTADKSGCCFGCEVCTVFAVPDDLYLFPRNTSI